MLKVTSKDHKGDGVVPVFNFMHVSPLVELVINLEVACGMTAL